MTFNIVLRLKPPSGTLIEIPADGVQAPNLGAVLTSLSGAVTSWPTFLPPIVGCEAEVAEEEPPPEQPPGPGPAPSNPARTPNRGNPPR